uniref:B-cell CLL/lymphoma 6 member B protein-like n=1 Tax=Pristiophorus japonicus TaxID=55135 RepID=UPI00398E8FCF
MEQAKMGSKADSYIKEFTRHSTDMMLNLNEMRKREILTDVKVLVDGQEFRAHKAVLIACSGFFYSVFSDQTKRHVSQLTLPRGISAGGFRLLLEFMYTSCLPLDAGSVAEVLTAAGYLQMDHVAETCRNFAHFSAAHIHAYLNSLDYPLARPHCLGFEGHRALPFIPTGPLAPSCFRHVPPGAGSGVGCFPQSAFRFPNGSRRDRTAGGSGASSEGSASPEEGSDPARPAPRAQKSGKPPLLAPDSPLRSDCRPNSPTESKSAVLNRGTPGGKGSAAAAIAKTTEAARGPTPDPKACNWKKYKYIVLNSLRQGLKAEGPGSPETLYARSGGSGGGNSSSSSGDESSTNMEEQSEDDDLNRSKAASRLSAESRSAHGYSVCTVCELHFEHTSELCHHILVCHPGEEVPEYHSEFSDSGSENGLFSCGTCELRFSDEESLQRHSLRVHSDEKPYHCDMCQAAFRYKGNLASHKTVHTGEKPYRCNVCGAQFNRPANLKTHSRIHSGEKPYKCETCGARFVQVAHLRAHVLIHTGEKPYPCETCGTRFRHLQTLKSHIRIHTGEKPYHCEKCDLHFRHKSQLRLHLRQKHGAITNTKIRYKVIPELYVSRLQPC